MDDIYGSYENKLKHENLWVLNGSVYSADKLTAEQLNSATKIDGITVIVTPEGECTETEFSKALAAAGTDYMSLFQFYDNGYVEGDTRGTANFKEFMELLFYTYYEGNFDESEQQNFADAKLLMKMSVSLGDWNKDGVYEITSAYDYVYEFYRVSDRQVLVKLYQQNRINPDDRKNAVGDFYISTFSFKKIVNAYFGILNKCDIENDNPYEDSYIGKK